MDDERHHEIVHVEPPGVFQGKVWLDVLVAGVESGCEKLLLFLLDKKFKKFLYYLLVICFLGCLDGVSIDLVFLGEVDALLELSVLSVEESSNSSEF